MYSCIRTEQDKVSSVWVEDSQGERSPQLAIRFHVIMGMPEMLIGARSASSSSKNEHVDLEETAEKVG